jgi:L-ascorbate metabolism protein UlaG (beta-lactamase superfamily)
MATRITFLGLAAYRVQNSEGKVVLIDPCLEDNPASPIKVADLKRVDVMLVTHLAFDHLGDAPEIARKTGCVVVCGADVKYALVRKGVDTAQIRTLAWSVRLRIGGIPVRSIMSRHASYGMDTDGRLITGFPMGFLFEADPGVRVYHSGDTALYGDLKLIGELYRPMIGLLCCCEMEREYLERHGIRDHDAGEMSGDEGAMAAAWLGLEYALCNHYLSPLGHRDVAEFVSRLRDARTDRGTPITPIVLEAGDTFIYPGGAIERKRGGA